MKCSAIIILTIVVCPVIIFGQRADFPRFSDYKTAVSKEKIKRPKWIKYSELDGWRDELGKGVSPPEVNFAGKYYLAGHSCGTYCRFYTLTDLTTAKELDILYPFTAAEPPPKTSDGFEYLSILFSQSDSRLLVVQYFIGITGDRCREKSFLYENQKLKPITGTKNSCRKF